MTSWFSVSLLLAACSGADPVVEPTATPAAVGGEPVGKAAAPVSADEAKAIYDAAMAAVAKQSPARKTATVDGAEVALYAWDDPRLVVSEGCAPSGVIGSCQALDALRDMPTKTVEVGPGNPASYYCPAAGGQSVSAHGADGESGLCRFADGSLIADWSLVYVPESGRAAK